MARLAWLVFAVTLLAACGKLPDKGAVTVEAGRPVRIGVVTVMDGPRASEGEGIATAARLAAAHHGPVKDHPVEVVVTGGGCGAEEAEAAVRQLVSDPSLAGVVGPICSAGCVAAERVLDTAALPMVTPRCTAIAVTRQGYPGVFRTGFTDAVEVVAGAQYIDETLRLRRVFLVHDGTIYARSVRDVFKLVWGKSNLAGSEEVPPGTADYGPAVRAIARSRAELVYYAGFAGDAARFVTQLRAAGVTLPVMAPDAVKDQQAFIQAAGPAAEGVFVTETVPEPGDGYDAFAAAYRERAGAAPGPYAAEAYDAVAVLLRALDRTASARNGRLAADRRALRQAVAATDLEGASGRIRFRGNGDRKEGAAGRVLRVQDGRFVEQAVVRLD